MNKKILFIPLSFLLFPALVNSCAKQEGGAYLHNEWYFTGYGSYINGKYNSVEGGVKLNKEESTTSGYKETYTAKNQKLSIGDSLYFVNKTKSIRIKDSFAGNSFDNKNVKLYEDNKKKSVDVLKSGKYNIQLDVKDNSALLTITNGEGTTDNLNPVTPSDQTVSLFENGDYHAAIREKESQVGLFKYASFIKNETNKTIEDDILLSNGDLWQGSYESNVNKGSALNKIAEAIGYDCFNLGNHEFDWGQENIANNQGQTSMAYIGCNIVNYKTKELVDYVAPYKIIERGDLKIGVIGSIGPAQWTSISSDMVQDIEFGDLEEYGKKYSDRLREEFGCHVIVFNTHSPTTTSNMSFAGKLAKQSAKTGKRYVDAFFFGHDHYEMNGEVSPASAKVPYCNSGSNGVSLSHITLNFENGEVTGGTTELLYPNASELSEDTTIKALFNQLVSQEEQAKADEVVGSANDNFADNTAANLMAKAVHQYVNEQGTKVDMAIVNSSRAVISKGQVTYSQVSDAFPFFNKIVVLRVTGTDANIVAKGNYCYHDKKIENSKTYLIATYDYIAYHMSQNREYDYFSKPNAVKTFTKYPCDILVDIWKASSTPLNPSDYTGENYTAS